MVEAFLKDRQKELGFEVRSTILGYIQRGGTPTAFERILATRLGCAAVDAVYQSNTGVMVGIEGHNIITTPIPLVVSNRKELDLSLYDLTRTLENPTAL